MSCELCKLEKITTWYKEEDQYVVLDCKTCKVPMVVYRTHKEYPSSELVLEMDIALAEVADIRFGTGNWYFRREQRAVKDHYHVHAIGN